MSKHGIKPLPYANDALKGIGAKTIEIHHDKLYAGYVNKRNEIEETLAKVDRSKANQIYSEMRGLKHDEPCRQRPDPPRDLLLDHGR
jgi:superoxide dismutase